MDVKMIGKTIKDGFVHHLPEIAMAAGSVGFVGTVVFAFKTAPKCKDSLDAAKIEKGEDLTVIETVKVAAPICWPVAVLGAASLGCFIFSNRKIARNCASAVAAWQLSDATIKELKEASIKTIGEKKTDEIINKMGSESVRKDPPSASISVNEDGLFLYKDGLSGRYFRSTKQKIDSAVNEVNRMLNCQDYACVNDFYDFIDSPQLTHLKIADKLGWEPMELLSVTYTYGEAPNGAECGVIYYNVKPTFWYDD